MRLLLALPVAAAALWSGPAAGAPGKEFRALVLAENSKVSIQRGSSAVITLRGVEGNNNALKYSIVEGPRYGRLSELQQADPNRQGWGFVRYEHGNDEESRTDTFRYRVTAPISGRSATATVAVNITDAPPRLGLPATLGFSAIVGEKDTKTLALTNTGGGTLRGQVRSDPPFFVEGDGTFELKRNRSKQVTLRFEPRSTGLWGPAKVQPARDDPTAYVVLRGEAKAPFAIRTSAETFDLKHDDSRALSVEIINLADNPQTVRISSRPEGLADHAAAVELGPRQSKELDLAVPAARKGPGVTLGLVFSTSQHREERKFEIPPVPAHIEVLTPQVDFSKNREAVLRLRNTGGVEGDFSVELPRGIDLTERNLSGSIPAGTESEIRMTWRVPDGGPVPSELLVQTPSGTPERVAIVPAMPEPEPSPVAIAENGAQAPPEPDNATAEPRTVPAEAPKPSWFVAHPKERTRLYSLAQEPGDGSCTVRLAIPFDPRVDGYRLERLRVNIPIDPASNRPGEATFEPVPHEGKVELAGAVKEEHPEGEASVIRATIAGLPPGAATVWRLVPLSGGQEFAPTREFTLSTKLPERRFSWQAIFVSAGGLCLLFLAWWKWRAGRVPG